MAAIGSLAPDIDHPRSLISLRIPSGLIAGALLLILTPPFANCQASVDHGMFSGMWPAICAQVTPFVGWGVLMLVVGFLLLVLSAAVRSTVSHRGPTHSLIVCAGAGVVVFLIALLCRLGPWVGLLFGLGWLTHILADALTPAGLPSITWPFFSDMKPGTSLVVGLLVVPLAIGGTFGWKSTWRPGVLGTHQLQTPPVTAASQPVVRDTALAERRLREAAPEIHSHLVNANSPIVSEDPGRPGYVSYAWEYLDRKSKNRVTVRRIKITLDASGKMVGVSDR